MSCQNSFGNSYSYVSVANSCWCQCEEFFFQTFHIQTIHILWHLFVTYPMCKGLKAGKNALTIDLKWCNHILCPAKGSLLDVLPSLHLFVTNIWPYSKYYIWDKSWYIRCKKSGPSVGFPKEQSEQVKRSPLMRHIHKTPVIWQDKTDEKLASHAFLFLVFFVWAAFRLWKWFEGWIAPTRINLI